MMADLGPSEEPERYARSAPEPLAFKPPPERAQSDEAPASRPDRPAPVRAPIVLASAAMRVPAAVQPTAQKVRDFRPAPIQVAEHAGPGLKGAGLKGADLKVAGLNPAPGHGTTPKAAVAAGRPARPTTPALTKLAAAAPAALPASAKSTLAHLALRRRQGIHDDRFQDHGSGLGQGGGASQGRGDREGSGPCEGRGAHPDGVGRGGMRASPGSIEGGPGASRTACRSAVRAFRIRSGAETVIWSRLLSGCGGSFSGRAARRGTDR